mgnify:FL=1
MYNENVYVRSKVDFTSKVMSQMGIGLFITFLTAYLTYSSEAMLSLVFGNPFMVFVIMAVEIALVVYLSRRIDNMSLSEARGGFYIYAALNGLTLSSIFIAYEISSIYITFFIAAVMFMASGLIGMSIKRDISGLGQFFYMSLIGIIVMSIVNMFLRLPSVDIMISAIGVVLFSGITAYDMRKIKDIHYSVYNSVDVEAVSKYSILGALELYLDFINIFLYLLNLTGRRNK